MISLIGGLGVILLAICALPQTIKTIKNGNAKGMSQAFLWCWFLGEVFTLIYLFGKDEYDYLLITNYSANILLLGIIVYYRYFPRKNK